MTHFPLQASKWLSLQVLIDEEEMAALCQALEPFEIYRTGAVVPAGEGKIPLTAFIDSYAHYIQQLKRGEIPKMEEYHSYFSTLFTVTPEVLYSIAAGDDRQLLRLSKPAIQLQPHSLDYSPYDGKFRPMVLGLNSIMWGIQYSYPQLYQDPLNKEVLSVGQEEIFPNTLLFRTLQRWVRHNTIPTPFQVEGRTINVPMRLGKNCLSWINHHPQLASRKLQIIT